MMSEERDRGNPLVALAGVVCGMSALIVTILAIFAKDQLNMAPWIVGALAVMGIALGVLTTKK